eukprot:365361-Chlamydomonas_euryale.AAC.3
MPAQVPTLVGATWGSACSTPTAKVLARSVAQRLGALAAAVLELSSLATRHLKPLRVLYTTRACGPQPAWLHASVQRHPV